MWGRDAFPRGSSWCGWMRRGGCLPACLLHTHPGLACSSLAHSGQACRPLAHSGQACGPLALSLSCPSAPTDPPKPYQADACLPRMPACLNHLLLIGSGCSLSEPAPVLSREGWL